MRLSELLETNTVLKQTSELSSLLLNIIVLMNGISLDMEKEGNEIRKFGQYELK